MSGRNVRFGQQKLVALQAPKQVISQDRVADLISQRDRLRWELRALRSEADSLIALIKSGAEIEPGPLPIEIESTPNGTGRVERLMIDGSPIDYGFFPSVSIVGPGRPTTSRVERGSVEQDTLAECMFRRGTVAQDLAWLREQGRALLEAIESGCEVEEGPFIPEIDRAPIAGGHRVRVLVGGRPIDDPE